MKILLVDDSNTMRRIQKTQLQSLGIQEIAEASNGKEALQLLKKDSTIQLVLLDWNMPVMDGFTLLKTLRADQAFKDLKIIMCTSESEKSRVVEALKAGANNYIVKPFSPDNLKKKLFA